MTAFTKIDDVAQSWTVTSQGGIQESGSTGSKPVCVKISITTDREVDRSATEAVNAATRATGLRRQAVVTRSTSGTLKVGQWKVIRARKLTTTPAEAREGSQCRVGLRGLQNARCCHVARRLLHSVTEPAPRARP